MSLSLDVSLIEAYDFECCRVIKKFEGRLVCEKILKFVLNASRPCIDSCGKTFRVSSSRCALHAYSGHFSDSTLAQNNKGNSV